MVKRDLRSLNRELKTLSDGPELMTRLPMEFIRDEEVLEWMTELPPCRDCWFYQRRKCVQDDVDLPMDECFVPRAIANPLERKLSEFKLKGDKNVE